jgi:hypothetical protein
MANSIKFIQIDKSQITLLWLMYVEAPQVLLSVRYLNLFVYCMSQRDPIKWLPL